MRNPLTPGILVSGLVQGSIQLDGQALGGEYFTQASLVPQKELLFG